MNDDKPARRRRAIYRAGHRGTKEMDWLLGRFTAARVDGMSDAELVVLEQLLALPDPDIGHWLTLAPDERPAGELGEIVMRIRRFHNLDSEPGADGR